MAEFRIAPGARNDLLDIYEFSESRFGATQADAYLSGLERTFGLLADFPGMGSSCDEVLARLKRFRFQSHYVFYFAEVDHVLIRGVIHVRQNIRPELFE